MRARLLLFFVSYFFSFHSFNSFSLERGDGLTVFVVTGSNGEQARLRAQQGFDMVSIITDVGAFEEGMMRNLGVAGGSTGEGGAGSGGY